MRRLPIQTALVTTVLNVPAIVLLIVSTMLARAGDSVLISVINYLVIPLVVLRLLAPFYTWWFLKYQLNGTLLTVKTGLIQVSERTVDLKTVTSVNKKHNLLTDRLALVDLEIVTGGENVQPLTLGLIPETLATQITNQINLADATPPLREASPSGQPQSAETQTRPAGVYTGQTADILATSLSMGRLFSLGFLFVLALLQGYLDYFANHAVDSLVRSHLIIFFVLVIVGILVSGMVASLLVYGRFELLLSETTIGISHGVFNRSVRSVNRAEVIGIVVKRNLVDLCFHRARLVLITLDSQKSLDKNLVLPAISQTKALELVRVIANNNPAVSFPSLERTSPFVSLQSRIQKALRLVLAGLGAIGFAFGGLYLVGLVIELNNFMRIAVIVAVWVGYYSAVKILFAKFLSAGIVGWLLWANQVLVQEAVFLTENGIRQVNESRYWGRLKLTRKWYFAGRIRSLSALSRVSS